MSSNTKDDGLNQLKAALGSCVRTDDDALFQASFDGLRVEARPNAVVKAESGEQVGLVLSIANEFGVPVTTRGAGSSLTGGVTPLAGGWVLDLSGLNGSSLIPPICWFVAVPERSLQTCRKGFGCGPVLPA